MFFPQSDRRLAAGEARRREVLPALPQDGALAELQIAFTSTMQAFEAEDSEIARDRMLGEALQPYLDQYETATGQSLQNPYELPAHDDLLNRPLDWIGLPRARDTSLRKMRDRYARAREQPGDRLVSTLPALPDDAGLTAEAVRRAQTLAERAERQALLSTSAAGTAGRVAGTLTGAIKDPTNLATMFAGAGPASGFLRTFLVEAGLGAGVEALMLPRVAAWKEELGREMGLADMAAQVATGAAAAGTFGVALKGGAEGARRLWRMMPSRARDAATILDSLDTVERRDPFKAARQVRRRAEATGEAPSARFEEILEAGDGTATVDVDLSALPRERAGDVPEVPPQEAPPAGAPTRGDLDRTTEQALHRAALLEAEDAMAAGRAPDGPAIRAIDERLPDLELPVYVTKTRNGRTVRRRGPMDLVTWLRAAGGLQDSGGELRARDLVKARGRAGVEFATGEQFLGGLTRDDGLSLDEAALRAWEAGYLGSQPERPSTDDLLEAIDQTMRAGGDIDRRVWSEHDADLIARLRERVDPVEAEHFAELQARDAELQPGAANYAEPMHADPETRAQPTVERTAAGDQVVLPGAEQISQREVLERRMAARDVRRGQQGTEGLELFDPGARARQGGLFGGDDEALAREMIGDELVDEALDVLEHSKVDLGERIEAPEQLGTVVMDDEAERLALEQLQSELAESDFEVLVDQVDEGTGEVVQVRKSARELWAETEAEAAGWGEAAACMIGAANAA